MESLYDKLIAYSESDFYGFHMPGHKRNGGLLTENLPFEMDITEIEGFDDLHHADGILKDAQVLAAQVYHADETHFLINGSTAGILSAILGCTQKCDQILVARNCHKSVYHAMYMNELKPIYLYPQYEPELELNGEVSVEDVRRKLAANPDTRAVVLVSPTYDGVVSDIAAIAEIVHTCGIPLIVDEAHGAHFGFHPYFPKNANEKGADIVIHSLHKTLPALTQTALLHVNGSLVNRRRIKQYLDMLQTSSPSYVLMASIDACVRMLADDCRREQIFDSYVEMLRETRAQLQDLKWLQMLETENFDPSKVVISTKRAMGTDPLEKAMGTDPLASHGDGPFGESHGDRPSGKMLYHELLEKYHLQMEMLTDSYVLAMTTVGDTEAGMQRLARALHEIDADLDVQMQRMQHKREDCEVICGDGNWKVDNARKIPPQPHAEVVYGIAEMMERKLAGVDTFAQKTFAESVGYISTEYAYIYPPGTPILVPGERVTKEAAELLETYRKLGFQIEGLGEKDKIEVWING